MVILYFDWYNDLRVLLVEASTVEEAEEIALARNIEPVGIKNVGSIMSEYERKKVRKQNERK